MFSRKPKPTPAELAALRQLAQGVMMEIAFASEGRCPRPSSPWPMLASAGSWALLFVVACCALALLCR